MIDFVGKGTAPFRALKDLVTLKGPTFQFHNTDNFFQPDFGRKYSNHNISQSPLSILLSPCAFYTSPVECTILSPYKSLLPATSIAF